MLTQIILTFFNDMPCLSINIIASSENNDRRFEDKNTFNLNYKITQRLKAHVAGLSSEKFGTLACEFKSRVRIYEN